MAEEKDAIKKEGNLQKQSRWLKSWRTRWTVLKPYPKDGNDYLATFKKEKEKFSTDKATEQIRIDDLTDAEVFIDKSDKEELMFYIENKKDKEKFLFKAQTKQDRDEWIKCIRARNEEIEEKQTEQQQQQQNGDKSSSATTKQKNNNLLSVDDAKSTDELNKSTSNLGDDLLDEVIETMTDIDKNKVDDKNKNDDKRDNDQKEYDQKDDGDDKQKNNDDNNNPTDNEQKQNIDTTTTEDKLNDNVEPETEQNDNIDKESMDKSEQAEPTKDEQINDESIKDEPIKDEQLEDEQVQDEQIKDEQIKDEQIKDEQIKEEQIKDEAIKDEAIKDEAIKDEQIKDEQIKDEQMNEEQEEAPKEDKEEVAKEDEEEVKEDEEETESNKVEANIEKSDEQIEEPEKAKLEQLEKEEETDKVEVADQDEQPKQEENADNNIDDEEKEKEKETEEVEETEAKSGLSATLEQAKQDEVLNNSEDEANDNVTDLKDTPVFKPEINDKSDTDDGGSSLASSLKSDGGDGPFGNRWGNWQLNDTMDQDTNQLDDIPSSDNVDNVDKVDNDENDDEKINRIDTSKMIYSNIILIGDSKSGKTSLLNQLIGIDKENDENKNELNENNDIKTSVFMDKSDENNICCSFIDTFGDLKNIANTVKKCSLSDIAIITVSVENEEISKSIKDFARIINTFGIEYIICCLTNIDSIDYNQEKYNKCKKQLTEKILKKNGIKTKKIAFIPINCKNGDNILKTCDNDKLSWYKGWNVKYKKDAKEGKTLIDAIRTNMLQFESKKVQDKDLILPISRIDNIDNNQVIFGKIEQGTLNKSDKINLIKSDNKMCIGTIKSIKRDNQNMDTVKHGDYIQLNLDLDDETKPEIGDILTIINDDNDNKIKGCTIIKALVDVKSEKVPVGFEGEIIIRGNYKNIKCSVSQIMYRIGKDGKKLKDQKYLGNNTQGQIELKLDEALIATSFTSIESLGRFVIIHDNLPVIVGKIESTQ